MQYSQVLARASLHFLLCFQKCNGTDNMRMAGRCNFHFKHPRTVSYGALWVGEKEEEQRTTSGKMLSEAFQISLDYCCFKTTFFLSSFALTILTLTLTKIGLSQKQQHMSNGKGHQSFTLKRSKQ